MKLSPELQAEFVRIMAHMRRFINRSVGQRVKRVRPAPQPKGTKAQ